jgi:electron transfer flavoprotein alpha subunit
MSVLIFADSAEGHVKKSSLEAISYGVKVAEMTGTTAEALILGPVENPAALGKYGVKKIHHAADASFSHLDAGAFTKAIAEIASQSGATIIVFSHNVNGKAIAPRLSARLKAGLVAGAVALPDLSKGFIVRKNVFSGKAYADISVTSPVKIVSLNPNAYPVSVIEGATAEVVPSTLVAASPAVHVTGVTKASGEVPLTEAEIVVSAGRGMKGPENWGIIEDLAKSLHAATACSRPVADAHWRPHNEHVGQTGFAIAPNLYIAIGISGAIQHLAGVNRSKVIVVINKDPEAPFFKAADYGIVGDAFEIVPQFTAAVKKMKGIA